MIITQLVGGLGNQMFQYAAGRTVAHRLNAKLKLDKSQFQYYSDRQYDLSCFAILEQFASQQDLDRVRMPVITTLKKPLQIIRQKIRGDTSIIRVKERHFHFDPTILELPDNTYLEGYWQSEKYFKEIEEIIRHDFSFKIPPDPVNRELGDRILSVNAVSIHVRRGDYVTNPVTNQTHGICDIDYYQRAIVEISKNVSNPYFFVFSDDQKWTKSHIMIDAPMEYLTHNRFSTNYEDMRLMSLCHHHIIANSSFSWWGAWLCSHPGKMIIAPKKWFNQSNLETRDLIPESWFRL